VATIKFPTLVHCLPAAVYIRVMHVMERRGLNKLNSEEYCVDHVHVYLRLDFTSDATVTPCHKEPGTCTYSLWNWQVQ